MGEHPMFILLSVCLMGSPRTCHEERINWSFDTRSDMECMLHGQEAIAKWQEGNKQWEIQRWRCVPKDRLATDI
jgi:hypothetical protein